MGIGNKLFTMPGEAIKFFATESKLILNVEKEKLKTAPRLEKGDKWPDFSDALWGERIYSRLRPPGSRRIDDSGRFSNRSVVGWTTPESNRNILPVKARFRVFQLFRTPAFTWGRRKMIQFLHSLLGVALRAILLRR